MSPPFSTAFSFLKMSEPLETFDPLRALPDLLLHRLRLHNNGLLNQVSINTHRPDSDFQRLAALEAKAFHTLFS